MLKRRRRRLKQNTHTHRARESVVQNLHRLLWSVKRERQKRNEYGKKEYKRRKRGG